MGAASLRPPRRATAVRSIHFRFAYYSHWSSIVLRHALIMRHGTAAGAICIGVMIMLSNVAMTFLIGIGFVAGISNERGNLPSCCDEGAACCEAGLECCLEASRYEATAASSDSVCCTDGADCCVPGADCCDEAAVQEPAATPACCVKRAYCCTEQRECC
jgi:hypothetical protein